MSQNFQQAMVLALEHVQSGRLAEAETIYRQILSADPNVPDALHMLGILAMSVGRNDAAEELVRRAIAVAPNIAEYHNNLGMILMEQENVDEAILAYQKAIALKPQFAPAHNNLGNALKDKGQLEPAFNSLCRALQLQPDYADAVNNLGTVLMEAGRVKDAIQFFENAIKLAPQNALAHNNLGNAYKQEGQIERAIDCYRKALAINPNLPATNINLGVVLADAGRVDEAIQTYRDTIHVIPDSPQLWDNLLYDIHLLSNPDPVKIFEEHVAFNTLHGAPLAKFIQPHLNDRAPGRPLRVGYVSPDFREHPVAFFFESLLAAHDPKSVDVTCYADLTRPDAITARLQKHAHHWHNITGVNDAQVAELVRGDQIDILIDLAGHTSGNRLCMFARKPAPVQMTYLGYPDTTGLATMDYRITDAFADPPGQSEKFHTEKLIRLPKCFLCYTPPKDAPQPAEAPSLKSGHITFGCFNAMLKINPALIAAWARILQQIPNSRLLLKCRAFADTTARQRILSQFAGHNIAADRLELQGWLVSRANHLALYNEIDIALDTFPYNGTTTTCEALWMGVPVIALAGNTHAGRVGVSILSTLKLKKLIAPSPAQYVKLAVKLAGDPEELTKLHLGLRERLAKSSLTDASAFAREMEQAYRTAWKEWIAQSGQ
jgi:predicted O-linked N-acetylglucosamine transferase (SPINDLY family)